MPFNLSKVLEGIRGDFEDFNFVKFEKIEDHHFSYYLETDEEDPLNIPVNVHWDDKDGILSVNVLLTTQLPITVIGRAYDLLNAYVHETRAGFIGKSAVAPSEDPQRKGFVDFVHGWEIGLTPNLLEVIDLGAILKEQMVRVCTESSIVFDKLTQELERAPH